jgi:ATP-binding cassette, subfamily C (CFTR/MRP), member 1
VSVASQHSDTESDPELKLKHGDDGAPLGKGISPGDAITIRDGNFGWKSGEDEAPLLKNVNLTVPASKLTVIIGPVGSGKSTLLKAVLGETPVSEGSILLSTREMSFCDQTPWLTNQTLQANITAFSKYDASWYSSVIRACALDQDLAQLPEGDQSMVGSKGITLSGGQKQRVVSRHRYTQATCYMNARSLAGSGPCPRHLCSTTDCRVR